MKQDNADVWGGATFIAVFLALVFGLFSVALYFHQRIEVCEDHGNTAIMTSFGVYCTAGRVQENSWAK